MHSAAVGSTAKNVGSIHIFNPRAAPTRPAAKFLRLAHLRRLKECEKVAAVCYRIRSNGVQFLLVQTRGGRWTFPKGSVEPGLTHAQSAALEAFEEAGVHGRMQEAPFTRYLHRKRQSTPTLTVNAHLCEVSRLESPPEPGRNRTWFSVEKAKERLREGRNPDAATDLARVVDRAVLRIRKFQGGGYKTPSKRLRKLVLLEGSPR